jgi:hypothetical protein
MLRKIVTELLVDVLGRVRLLGSGAGRVFAAGDWLGAGTHAGSPVGRDGAGDCVRAAAARAPIGASFRSGGAVCQPRLRRFVGDARSADQHVAPRQSLGQCDLRIVHENAECEEVYRSEYRNLTEARARIGEFLEEIYNQKRLHSFLGYCPPAEFERRQSSRPRLVAAVAQEAV